MFRRNQRSNDIDHDDGRNSPDHDTRDHDARDHDARDHGIEDHDRGLAFDLDMLVNRRRALTLFGGAGLVAAAAACAPPLNGNSGGSATTTSTTTTSTTGGSTTSTTGGSTSYTAIPEETGGPYPGDGSNGPNVLTQSGIVRSDIRSSFGSASGTAEGVLNTVRLTVLSLSNGASALTGAAIYIWHCNRDGAYSMYGQGITNENYLRGVQETDANGEVTFTSIFPAAYSGRWPHIHFEIYPSLSAATSASSKLRTSQLALPQDACNLVYATTGYSQSVRNLAQTSLATDMVFSDGWSSELATVTGDVNNGMLTTLTVAV